MNAVSMLFSPNGLFSLSCFSLFTIFGFLSRLEKLSIEFVSRSQFRFILHNFELDYRRKKKSRCRRLRISLGTSFHERARKRGHESRKERLQRSIAHGNEETNISLPPLCAATARSHFKNIIAAIPSRAITRSSLYLRGKNAQTQASGPDANDGSFLSSSLSLRCPLRLFRHVFARSKNGCVVKRSLLSLLH